MRLVWLGFVAFWVVFGGVRLGRGRPFWRWADETIILGGCAAEVAVWVAYGR